MSCKTDRERERECVWKNIVGFAKTASYPRSGNFVCENPHPFQRERGREGERERGNSLTPKDHRVVESFVTREHKYKEWEVFFLLLFTWLLGDKHLINNVNNTVTAS